MKIRTQILGGCLIATLGVGAGTLIAQHDGNDMDEQKMMEEAYMKAGQPGEHHKKLNQLVGKWDLKVTMWAYPGATPETSDATATYKWIMDGRFLLSHIDGAAFVPGQDFKGMEILGYDNLRKTYTAAWVDNFGTAITTSRGEWNDATSKFISHMEHIDPISGEAKESKWIMDMSNHNKIFSKSLSKGPDGQEFKDMEIVYTRSN